jgi:hypothetical protein
MKKIAWLVCFIFLLGGVLQADYLIKQKSHTDAISMMGQTQPARDDEVEIWISDDLNRMATHSSKQSTIIDLTKKVMYLVNHTNRTYVEMQLPVDITKYLPDEMAQMVGQMVNSITVQVTPTGKKKKIGRWDCDEYDVVMDMMMMKVNMKVWATTDVPFSWEKVSKEMMAQVMAAQLRLNEQALSEFQKIKGQWIASETSMSVMGNTVRSTTEVVDITKKDAPAGVYHVPDGYTKKEKLSMEDLQKR